MDPELLRGWRQWAASERESPEGSGPEEDRADAAFRALFKAVPDRLPSGGFRDRVTVAAARAADRHARAARVWVAVGISTAAIAAVALLLQLPHLLRAFVDLLIGAVVSTALALSRGLDVWSVLAQLARAIGAVVNTPQVTYALVALGAVAIGALYALQRVLDLEERSSP